MLQDWQQRVVEEKKELDEKIDKLGKFLKGLDDETLPNAVMESISEDDFDLLNDQYTAMLDYSDCLGSRIERFSK